MKYKLISLIIALSLFLGLVNAQTEDIYDYDVTIKPVKSSIYLNETAEYLVTIYNNNIISNRYRFDEFDFTKWSTDARPSMLSGVNIPAKSQKTVRLFLFPLRVMPGLYSLQLVVRADKTKTIVKKPIRVNLRSRLIPGASYEEDIEGTFVVGVNNKLDPRRKESITIKLRNRNLLYINDVDLKVEDENGLFSFEKKGLDFVPLERKDVRFEVTIDSKIAPQEGKLIISWDIGNVTFGPYGHPYEIIGYELPFEVTKEKKKKFLRTDNVATIKNQGTLEKEETVKIEITAFKRIFTSSQPKTNIIEENNKKYFVFNVKLQPGETKEVKAITSYRLITFIILLIIIGIILYYKYRSPLVVRKKESIIKMKEGGISELKILLYVKNRSKFPIENIEIKERIPHIAEIDKEIQIGTIKPSSVTKKKEKGTIVKWEISSLDKFEERIITYNVKSKLSILGGLILPSARIKFKAENKERVTESNKLKLTSS